MNFEVNSILRDLRRKLKIGDRSARVRIYAHGKRSARVRIYAYAERSARVRVLPYLPYLPYGSRWKLIIRTVLTIWE